MLEVGNWYKVMDSADKRTEIFAVGNIFKLITVNSHVVKVYSPTKNRQYHIMLDSIKDMRMIKIDSKAAELLYAKI